MQPEAFVPDIVYVVVTLAVQLTVAPVLALNPVTGDQLYVLAPVAVIVADEPMHIAGEVGVTVTAGAAFTVTVAVT